MWRAIRSSFDREDNTWQLANHLLRLGHREIGFFDVSHIVPDNPRVRGLARALAQFGLKPRADWIYGSALYGEFEEDGVAMARLFSRVGAAPDGGLHRQRLRRHRVYFGVAKRRIKRAR